MIRNHVRQHDRSGRLARSLAFPLLILGLLVTAACGVAAQAAKSPAQQANDLVNAGVKAQAAGLATQAADNYHKALSLDPRNKFAYFDLGVIDQTAGRNATAELEYRTAIQYDPNFGGALPTGANQKAQAKAELDRAVPLDPAYASRIPASLRTTATKP